MTKRFNSRRVGNTTIKTLEKQPVKFAHPICPLNLEEQKERFLKYGKLPKFVLKGSEDEIENLFNKARNQIRFDLFGEAEHILKTVKEKFGDGDNYLNAQFGEKITKDEATQILEQYLRENNLDGAMSIVWCADLASSARMMWIGPHCKHNRPEARNYSFWIKNSDDNNFLREQGIRCLADHEIGTHFVRAFNDGFQPWYSNRKRFSLRASAMTTLPAIRSEEGLAAINTIMNSRFRSFNDGLQPWYSDRQRFDLRGRNSIEELRAEEGLAAINTILNSKVRFLWGPALLYYTACKAAEMTFKQLYDHLVVYVQSPEHRWRLCMRVKRGLLDPNDLGGYGKDQCYFEGAVEILRSLDMIDFNVMMSGKICVDEVQRCKRLARLDCLKLPAFMKNENRYKKHLKAIAHLNGLDLQHQKKNAPAAYVRRLKQGRRIGTDKVRRIRKKCFTGSKSSSPMGSHSADSAGSEQDDCCYGSSDSREGGGEITEQTPVVKFNEMSSTKDPRIDSGIVSDTHCSISNENCDSISLKSCETFSVKSTVSLMSECKSFKSETSGKSVPSLTSNISEISMKSGISDCQSSISGSSQRTACSNSSVKSKMSVKCDNAEQSDNVLQRNVPELVDKFSINNNAKKLGGKKDILPPLISLADNGQKSWTASKNGILHSNDPPLLPHPNHNVCTTIISNEDKELADKKPDSISSRSSRMSENKDFTDCLSNRSETSEVTFPNVYESHVVGFSSLTKPGLIRTKVKSANQSSVFHSGSDNDFKNGHTVMELGPEKFIYPDFDSFLDSNFVEFQSPFLPSPHSALVDLSNKILRRRAKSATCNRHSKNQNGYPV